MAKKHEWVCVACMYTWPRNDGVPERAACPRCGAPHDGIASELAKRQPAPAPVEAAATHADA